jgi:hypothetical protein
MNGVGTLWSECFGLPLCVSEARRPQLRGHCDLRLLGLPVPWHEFIPSGGRPVGGDFGDDISDVGLWVDAIHFAGLDDGIDGGGAIAADL